MQTDPKSHANSNSNSCMACFESGNHFEVKSRVHETCLKATKTAFDKKLQIKRAIASID